MAVPGPVADFGECVWWMELSPNGRPDPLAPRYHPGYFVGFVEGTNAYLVLTERGAIKCRSIQRRPESERWSDHLLNCTCSVLQPNPLNPGEVRVGIKAPIHVESSDGPPIPPTDSGQPTSRGPQRTRLMAKYFRDFGFTEGCPGCNTRLPGRNLPPEMLQNHIEACRSRIESCLAKTTWGQAKLHHA